MVFILSKIKCFFRLLQSAALHLPKGTSFEYLTQWDLNLIVNNINSVPRQSLLGLTPYRAAKENFDMDVLLALQLRPVDPDQINLTPELIK